MIYIKYFRRGAEIDDMPVNLEADEDDNVLINLEDLDYQHGLTERQNIVNNLYI